MNSKNMSLELKQCLGIIAHDSDGDGNNPKTLYRAYQLLMKENYGFLPAQRMLERAAALGYEPACIDLAMLYCNGRYLDEDCMPVHDEKKMVEWLQRAASHRDPQACLLLAHCYCTGTGCQKDESTAYRYINMIGKETLKKFFNHEIDWDKRFNLNEINIIPIQILYLQTLLRGSTKR